MAPRILSLISEVVLLLYVLINTVTMTTVTVRKPMFDDAVERGRVRSVGAHCIVCTLKLVCPCLYRSWTRQIVLFLLGMPLLMHG